MQLLGYLITSIGSMLILYYCYEKLFTPHRYSSRTTAICFAIGAVLSIAQTLLSFDENLNSIINVSIFFALTCPYSVPWLHRFFTALLLFVLNVLGEGSGCILANLVFHIDLTAINETVLFPVVCLICILFQAAYAVFIIHALRYFKNHPRKIKNFIFVLITILVFCIIDLFVTFSNTADLISALILSVLLIAVIAGCLYLFYDQSRIERERLQLAHLEEMQRDQIKHYTALYEANRQVAVQRHDLKNILLNVRSYMQLGEYDKLDRFVAGFQQQLQPAALIDNGMPFIDAVLSAKMAEHADIPFTLRVSPLVLEHLDQSRIAFVLAGALDNAIEACQQSAKPFIRVQLGQKGRAVSLVVENAADKPVKSIGDTLLTTKANAAAHGYGVRSMQQTAEQAHGALTWRHENGVFTLSVLFQDL